MYEAAGYVAEWHDFAAHGPGLSMWARTNHAPEPHFLLNQEHEEAAVIEHAGAVCWSSQLGVEGMIDDDKQPSMSVHKQLMET